MILSTEEDIKNESDKGVQKIMANARDKDKLLDRNLLELALEEIPKFKADREQI